MKKKIIGIVVLALALIALAAPQQAFAQRTRRLSESEVQSVFDRINKAKVNSQDVREALEVLQCYTQWKSVGKFKPLYNPPRAKQRSLMDIIDPDLGWVSTASNLKDLYYLYLDYITYKDTNSIKKASSLAFDAAFFAVGFAPGAPYYRACIAAVERGANLLSARAAEPYFLDMYNNNDIINNYFKLNNPRWKKEPTSFDESGIYMPIGGILNLNSNSNEYNLVNGWFCALWEPSMVPYDQFCIFQDIAHYVLALQILEEAGVL